MSAAAKRAYRRFAAFFLAVGGVFLALAVLRAAGLSDLLRGNPVPVALVLLAIGGALAWTVARAPLVEPEEVAEGGGGAPLEAGGVVEVGAPQDVDAVPPERR
ncbi:MAG: hypothetical protein RI554_01855 [Trueperaceae bacterium]|nr:hypothetical protein [Trueperaceae bacterium]